MQDLRIKSNAIFTLYRRKAPLFWCKKQVIRWMIRCFFLWMKPMKCNQCTYTCTQSGVLEQHVRSKHTGEKPFKCNACDYRSVRKETIKIHEMTHTGTKPMKCSQCAFTCIQRGTLTNHERTHSQSKQFQCDLWHVARKQDFCVSRGSWILFFLNLCLIFFSGHLWFEIPIKEKMNTKSFFIHQICLEIALIG